MSNMFENNMTPEQAQKMQIAALSAEVETLELQLASFKGIEAKHKELKAQLFKAMCDYNIKSWETDAVKITRVDEIEGKIITEKKFNEEAFKACNPTLYEAFLEDKEIIKNGRAGYVKITVKGEKNE